MTKQATQENDLQEYDEGADFDDMLDAPADGKESEESAEESLADEPESAETESEGDPGGSTEGEAEPEPPEWYSKLDDDARKNVDDLMQAHAEREELRRQYNSLHGRLAPVQQENHRLRQQLQERQVKPAPAEGKATPPTPQDLSGSEEFQKYKQDFPEEAAAIEKEFRQRDAYIQQMQEKLQRVEQGFNSFNQQQSLQQQQQAYAQLSDRHPDYQDCIGSEEYQQFLQTQPREFQQIAMTTQDPATASWVLDQFKTNLQMQIDAIGSQQGQQGNEAQSIRDKRQRQLNQITPRSSQAGLGVIDGSDGADADIFDSLLE